MAMIVVLEETWTAAEYVGDESVGVVPSVVKWIVAPGVVEEMVTFWAVV